jgi:alanyl-tRNA synthetase
VGDEFAGYESTTVQGTPIVAMFDQSGSAIETLDAGSTGYIAIAKTPFYLESGGQVSDSGRILGADGSIAIVERLVRPNPSRPRLHLVRVERGRFTRDQIVTAEVADEIRDATRRNHTATHLLHAALRGVLGPHVKQGGSLVAPDRLRFDFAHHAPLTSGEIQRIERIVNEQIVRNTAVLTEIESPDQAIARGAMALFGEKYGDRVRVVSVPSFSIELCGGTHVRATGDIGAFVITEESGVAAGVRRIEAVTGAGALTLVQSQRALLDDLLSALSATPSQATETVQRLLAEQKRLTREVDQLKMKVALGQGPVAHTDEAREVAGVKVLTRRVEGLEKNALRALSDSLRDRLGSGVVVIASAIDGKVALVVSVSSDLTGRIQAGRVVKELAPIVGGGGGGRPDFAEAGGKNAAKIDALLASAPKVIETLLGAV